MITSLICGYSVRDNKASSVSICHTICNSIKLLKDSLNFKNNEKHIIAGLYRVMVNNLS